MLAYDLQFSLFQEALYTEGISSNLSLDILGVGAGVLGGVVGRESASRGFSALSGALAGTKTAINKNLYYERTLSALLALMVANREKIKVEIYRGLQQDDATYPPGRAMADLERYYIAGSIPRAIASVNEEAGETQAEAEIKFNELRDETFVSAQRRIDKLLDAVDKLPPGKALSILQTPPLKLPASIEKVETTSLDGKELTDLKDTEAKSVLKRILVLIQRSEEDLSAWEAAVITEE